MRPNWLIQTNIEGIDTEPMISEVRAQGMEVGEFCHELGMPLCLSIIDYKLFTICYGDIDFVRRVRLNFPFIPGAWCNIVNMRCSTYYAHLGEHLLNEQYIMLPCGDLLRRWTEIVGKLGGGPLFVRPDSGMKPFTGYVVDIDKGHEIESLTQAIGPETLVIVAPKKTIINEWRFVICERKVIAGCRYLPDESQFFTPPPCRLAKMVAESEWQPDICYTVDIAEEDNGRVSLLEINSFSCAGFYGCDISSIVESASKAAMNEWNEYLE